MIWNFFYLTLSIKWDAYYLMFLHHHHHCHPTSNLHPLVSSSLSSYNLQQSCCIYVILSKLICCRDTWRHVSDMREGVKYPQRVGPIYGTLCPLWCARQNKKNCPGLQYSIAIHLITRSVSANDMFVQWNKRRKRKRDTIMINIGCQEIHFYAR